jgi:hypothetical protein
MARRRKGRKGRRGGKAVVKNEMAAPFGKKRRGGKSRY